MRSFGKYLGYFLLGLLGCEETQDWSADGNGGTQLVVESLLTNEKKRHEVKLSETFTDINQSVPPVNDAFVALNDGDTTVFLARDPDRPGIYLTDTMRALAFKIYTLFILHDGKEYFSAAIAAYGTPLDPLVLDTLGDDQYEYLYQESNTPSMTEVIIDWEELNDANQIESKELKAYYYTLDVIDINMIFAPEKERLIFPKGAQISRRKFSLTENHQAFLRSLLSEVDWRGSPFDVAPGNVTTNISGGAVGYFSVSMVRSEQVIVN